MSEHIDRRVLLGAAGLAGVAAFSKLARAGDLDPPRGPIEPTMKPLDQIEPRIAVNSANTPGDADSLFKSTQRGSYYLTGNIQGVSGKHGIEIAADGVTLDLMGFDVRGVPGALRGIVSSGSGVTNIMIMNGSIGGWPSGGVNFLGNGFFLCKDLRVSANTGIGISMDTGQIEGCCAVSNTGTGLQISQGGTITRCFVSKNGGTGIDAGIVASITNCAAISNTGNGIQASGNSVIAQCSSQQNTGTGFDLDFATVLTDSASRSNSGAGVQAKGGSTVRGCAVDRNFQDGILASSRSMILNNSVSLNGQDAGTTTAGIRVIGGDNRIEGNNCVQNDIGIRVEASGNLIFGNSCSGSSFANYDFVANNRYGPIINISASGTAAVNGNSATSTLASTDPHANFAY